MRRFVTHDTADRLLTGHTGTDDRSGPVADVVAALRKPAEAGELAGTDDVIARIITIVRHHGTEPTTHPRRRPVLDHIRTGKAALIAAVAIFSAGTAAAATGNFPKPSHTFSHASATPSAESDDETTTTMAGTTTTMSDTTSTEAATTTTTEASTSTSEASTSTSSAAAASEESATPVGPDATGPAKQGLCTAFLHKRPDSPSLDAVAFQNLAKAATDAGQSIEEYCQPAEPTTTSTAGVATTEPVETGASGSTPAATAPGKGGDQSGSTPAATAPRGHG